MGLGQRLATRVLTPISDHPLRAAAGFGAVLAAAVMWVGVTASTGAADTGEATAVTVDAVLAFAVAHPAYPAAVLVGLAVALFGR